MWKVLTLTRQTTVFLQFLRVNCDHVLTFLPQIISRLMSETSSGSFCSNDCIFQSLMVALPFGGVGECVMSHTMT